MTRELRRAVLRPQLTLEDTLPGDDVPDAVHVGALDGDEVVGTCFVYPDACPWWPGRPGAWHLRQMATAPDRQGQGVGRLVLAGALGVALERGAALVWCHARESAAGFYRRHGFAVEGGVFTDAEHTVPHVRMWWEPTGRTIASQR